MRRHAAAVVLAELAPKDDEVVAALGEALATAEPLLVTAILGAFEAIGSKSAASYVAPLLESPEMEIKLRAAALVAAGGAAMVPTLRDQMARASTVQKRLLADILARIHTRDAFQALLDLLFDPDFELVKEVCEAVRRHIGEAGPKDRLHWHTTVIEFMKSDKAKGVERVLTSCLLLLGAVGRPEARPVLLAYAGPSHSLYLRRHALIGLKHIEIPKPAAAALAKTIRPMIDDADEGIARHALEILARLGGSAPWSELLESPHSTVRSFAARRIAETDNDAVNRRLLGLLDHRDTDVQEVAAGALAAHTGATKILLDALIREPNEHAAWRLAKILKPHSERIAGKALKILADLAGKELRAGERRHEALLYLLRNVDSKTEEAVLKEAGMAFRKAGKWVQAVDCFRKLINTASFDETIRYALSVCNLKTSLKDLSPHARAEDHSLRGFHGLLRSPDFGLAARLKKDKDLDPADLYYVGFHFVEMQGEDQAFGRDILAHLAKTRSRAEEGRAAKNKLKLTGA